MGIQDNQIFELYKPLRNYLRQVNLQESLYVFWAYVQHLQINRQIPSDIQTPIEIVFAKNKVAKTFYEWELETLTREVIINSPEVGFASKTLREWVYFAGAVNKLKYLENEIVGMFVNKTNILTEFHRIAHRQFPWQTNPNKGYITRYFKIFNPPSVNDIIKKVIGLTSQELYLLLVLFWGTYINYWRLSLPFKIENIPEINGEHLNKFLSCFSRDLPTLRRLLIEEQEINEKFVYSYSSLRAYPIIKIQYKGEDSLICPSPPLLVWRLTSGIYYELCGEKGFDIEFGKSFQNYVGEVLSAGNQKVKIYPEEVYYDGKNRKDAIDWIADEDTSALFIECKAKRMTMPSKIEIKSKESMERDLDIMADSVVQTYKNIKDYRDNKHPSFKFKKDRKIFPLIVTLEEWYLFGDELIKELKNKVKVKFKTNDLSEDWLSEMPYSLCSIQEFETMIQIMEKVGVESFMAKKVYNQDKEKWNFFPFIRNEFPEEEKGVKFLFPNDFHAIFPKQFFDKHPEYGKTP